MADPVIIAKVVQVTASLLKEKKTRTAICITLGVVALLASLIVALPVAVITSIFSLLSPSGDALQQDPYYIAIQEIRQELAIDNDLPVVIAKSVDILWSGDMSFDVLPAKEFVQEHFVGSYERTISKQQPDPINPDVLIEVEETETIYYFHTTTEMLRIVQEPPYNFSEKDIRVIQDMYLLSEDATGAESFAGTLPMPVVGYLTSGYGNRFDPLNGEYFMHPAIDILPTWHAPVIAIADGVVVDVNISSIYGNNVTIQHTVSGRDIYSFSAHLSKVDVHVGDEVTQGQTIGLEGGDQKSDPNPGRTTGHHLHFEIWESPVRAGHVNPSKYLRGG